MNTIPPDTNSDLLKQVAEGNEVAFSRLFEQYHRKLGVFVLKLTGNPGMAEEVVQDIFLKLWQQRSGLTTVRNFDTYLFVISRNHTYSLLRKVMAEKRRIERWAQDIQLESEAEGSEPEHLDELYESVIEAAITRLPPQQQKVYRLKKQEGLKYKQIGELMNLSPETVKKHLEAAIRNITVYLQTHIPIPVFLMLIPLYL
ncbi:MAG: polymerase ECF-type sigma factor [Ferruginibacter sp.]|nr:polymerase ECF-type sigma factor [Ferruginibacter sp.]